MADYDFRSLSPHDFELLCRDLLQKRIGVALESFTMGRDSGIDFRYRSASVDLIVQCKHYYCVESADILGREDINNLLTQDHLEPDHFREGDTRIVPAEIEADSAASAVAEHLLRQPDV
jgi:hypothetical protein